MINDRIIAITNEVETGERLVALLEVAGALAQGLWMAAGHGMEYEDFRDQILEILDGEMDMGDPVLH